MKRLFYSILVTPIIVVIPIIGAGISAEEKMFCPEILDKQERLECFDREFPAKEKVVLEQTSTPSVSPDLKKPKGVDKVRRDVKSTVSKPDKERNTRGLFDWSNRDELKTEIAAIRAGSNQRMVFRLTNGQIWMQSTPRSLPFKKGDSVVIKTGIIGGYIMRSTNGISSRVTLIKG